MEDPSYTLGTLKYYAKQSNQEEYYSIVQNKEINVSSTEIHSDYSWASPYAMNCSAFECCAAESLRFISLFFAI